MNGNRYVNGAALGKRCSVNARPAWRDRCYFNPHAEFTLKPRSRYSPVDKILIDLYQSITSEAPPTSSNIYKIHLSSRTLIVLELVGLTKIVLNVKIQRLTHLDVGGAKHLQPSTTGHPITTFGVTFPRSHVVRLVYGPVRGNTRFRSVLELTEGTASSSTLILRITPPPDNIYIYYIKI